MLMTLLVKQMFSLEISFCNGLAISPKALVIDTVSQINNIYLQDAVNLYYIFGVLYTRVMWFLMHVRQEFDERFLNK